MVRIRSRELLFSWSLLLAMSGSLAAAADPADVSGTWQFEIQDGDRTFTPTFVLEQNGEQLSGTYQNSQGDNPANGSVNGNAVTLNAEITVRDGSKRTVTYVGTINGEMMTGTMQGSRADVVFTASRKSD